MRNLLCNFFVIIFVFIIFSNLFISDSFSFPGGISGRTKKTSTYGCGNCHTFGTTITAVINGPDTLVKGENAQYSITITKANSGLGGLDIAVLKGTLDPYGGATYLKMLEGELVHNGGISFSSSITINFRYTAPTYATTDSIFATVNAGYAGKWNFVSEKIIVVKNSIGIGNNNDLPVRFELKQNYPNPFNPNTKIVYNIPDIGKRNPFEVSLKVYNIIGEEIVTLVNGKLNYGTYETFFDGSNLPSGIYFYKLTVSDPLERIDNFSEVKRMSLIK
jgi:hypothetical protein